MAAADQGVDVLISWGGEVHPPVPTHEEEGRKEERKQGSKEERKKGRKEARKKEEEEEGDRRKEKKEEV